MIRYALLSPVNIGPALELREGRSRGPNNHKDTP